MAQAPHVSDETPGEELLRLRWEIEVVRGLNATLGEHVAIMYSEIQRLKRVIADNNIIGYGDADYAD